MNNVGKQEIAHSVDHQTTAQKCGCSNLMSAKEMMLECQSSPSSQCLIIPMSKIGTSKHGTIGYKNECKLSP